MKKVRQNRPREAKVKKPRLVPGCPDLAVNGKPGCKLHNRTYDCLRYKYVGGKGEADPEKLAEWQAINQDRERLRSEMDDCAQRNPPRQMYVRKDMMETAMYSERNTPSM